MDATVPAMSLYDWQAGHLVASNKADARRLLQKKGRFAPRGAGAWAAVARSGVVACVQEVTVTPGELLADADLIHYTMGASEKDEEETIRKASDGRLVRPTLARRASGIGNWDQPKHTTCRGRPIWENPTYSAFWSVFGAAWLRLQRLASSVGFGTTAGLGPGKNLPYSGVTPEP
jgi:hypothetical protein